MKIKAPCKDCADRVVGCHSTCDKYKDWKEQDRQRKELIYESKIKDHFYRSTTTTKLHRKKQNQTVKNKPIPYMRDK